MGAFQLVTDSGKTEEQEWAEAYVQVEMMVIRHNARVKARPRMKRTCGFMLTSLAVCVGIAASTAEHADPWWTLAAFFPSLLLAFAFGLMLERYWGEG